MNPNLEKLVIRTACRTAAIHQLLLEKGVFTERELESMNARMTALADQKLSENTDKFVERIKEEFSLLSLFRTKADGAT